MDQIQGDSAAVAAKLSCTLDAVTRDYKDGHIDHEKKDRIITEVWDTAKRVGVEAAVVSLVNARFGLPSAEVETICERCAAANGLVNQDTPLATQRRVDGYPSDLCAECVAYVKAAWVG